ncbi:MAG: hypothetical protein A2504_00785 [Bdellovibrionales bacterium RIFOXYD12_FULL_39_22]|nr:MAG: hypothetical protein A2385_03405 [Bdellovibrionales bacterium RIFOXYB1_FULL_39_21]OFZ42626.1 MAG: hypothetical protein A2485_09900 [Bdellovibrionales bacterium RIFOXYC12_FULL_39_17]OFZ47106.1 MAG: hypothetical protein A2404_15395 [Bdellovibrionales bacterium RIFOXYC1_FULL_39_130]OFZ68622.1 MAG: hypothetical protein A2451_16595 [Bdellovibrionales bacterium RIFOXYC2_FULL_39_8]OFZ75354.1 MAG: hypothetical protein A2560_14170 [Bdellovibrionales bacterium RIFOXYD1_FULL_39_84]OFZ93305.1 MAG:
MKSLFGPKLTFKDYFADILFDLINIRENKNVSQSVLINQIFFTGYEAFNVMAIISLLLCAAIILQGHAVLVELGQKNLIYTILASTAVRDIGPLIISFFILARSGIAISTELGNMKVNKEIDALKALGISPISYIVTPRIIGMVLSMAVLAIYFSIIGVFGGYIVSNVFNPLPFSEFFDNFIKALSMWDLAFMILKTCISGFAIAVICSFHGMGVQRSITEVPQRNITAVAHSIFAILIIHTLAIIVHYTIIR